jgi:hypothetical protein
MEKLNIYQKLIAVRESADYLQKTNSGYQFKYVSSSQVLLALREKMDEYKLLLIPKITGKKWTIIAENKSDKGKLNCDILTELDLEFEWIDADNPVDRINVPFYSQGLDTQGEKGVGKALTYGEKYFLLKFFNIATDKDDPDAHQTPNEKPAPKKEEKPARDYTKEANNCKTVDELGAWYKSLNPDEQKKYKALTTERKKELSEVKIDVKQQALDLINGLSKINYERQLEVAEGVVSKLKPAEGKQEMIQKLIEKAKTIDPNYVCDILPF